MANNNCYTTNKLKDTTGQLVFGLPKVKLTENESASNSSVISADKEIEMDYKIALQLQQ